MKTPLISIVIPVYNGEKYIKRCIDSILKQTYSNFEIIIINDGSTDNTKCILEGYEGKKTKVINNENHGVGYSRNVGIREAIGDYITFIDSDDFIGEKFLESFVKQISSKKYDLIIGGYVKYNGKNNKVIYVSNDEVGKYLHTGPRGRMFSRNFIISNKILFPDRPPGEDAYFNILAYNLTKNIGIIKSAEYYYDITNENSIMHSSKNFNPRFLERLSMMVVNIKPIDYLNKELIDYSLVRSSVMYLIFYGRNGNAKIFMDYYNKIFSYIKNNIPDYKSNKYISIFSKSDSNFLCKIVVCGFITLDKLGLVSLFSKIWCK